MADWRPAACLPVFHRQLAAEHPAARPPATDPDSWGLKGDGAHDSTSDHAPHDFPEWGRNIVTAADVPHAPKLGLDLGPIMESLRLSHDDRIKYVIFDGRIFSSYAIGSRRAWEWGPYGGKDQHRDHGHLSVVGDRRSDNTRPWQTGGAPPMTMTPTEHRWLGNAEAIAVAEGLGWPTVKVDFGDGVREYPNLRLADSNTLQQILREVQAPAPVGLSDADREAIGALLAGLVHDRVATLEAKIDLLLAGLGATGTILARLDPAHQA